MDAESSGLRRQVVLKTVLTWCLVACCGLTAAHAAPPATLDDVVLFARDKLTLARGGRLTTGQVVVNTPGGLAKIDTRFKMVDGTQVVADLVRVRGIRIVGPELFDVFTNSFGDPHGLSVINGEGPTSVSLPIFSYPPDVTVTPGDSDFFVGRYVTATIPPGDYKRIIVGRSAALYFQGGTYNVRFIQGAGGSAFLFNDTTTLNVAEWTRLGRGSTFMPTFADAPNPRCVVMNVSGTKVTRFGAASNVRATVNVPQGRLQLRMNGNYEGNFTAAVVKLGLGANLLASPHLVTACP